MFFAMLLAIAVYLYPFVVIFLGVLLVATVAAAYFLEDK